MAIRATGSPPNRPLNVLICVLRSFGSFSHQATSWPDVGALNGCSTPLARIWIPVTRATTSHLSGAGQPEAG
jgi:hypothetical protein